MILNKKAPQIQAIQFKGGLDSAIEVMTWLYTQDRRVTVTYHPPLLIDDDHLKEHVLVTLGNNPRSVWMLHVDRWIVLDPESGVYMRSTENLFAEYEEAPGD